MLRRVFLAVLIVAGIPLSLGSAAAQSDSAGVVSGTARVHWQAKPNLLRLEIQLRAYGATADAAIANLKNRRDAAIKELKSLDADAASIVCTAPAVGSPLESILRGAIPSPTWRHATPVPPSAGPVAYNPPAYAPPGAVPSNSIPPSVAPIPDDPAPSVPAPLVSPPSTSPVARPSTPPPPLASASVTLTADWPLKGDDVMEIIAAAETICAKVRKAPFADPKNATAHLSPEEQERVEETMLGSNSGGSPFIASVTSPVGPTAGISIDLARLEDRAKGISFTYVAVLSTKQRKKMLAEAYAKAKERASELAESAGMRLGPINNLNGGVRNSCSPVQYSDPMPRGPVIPSWNESESVATSPDKLEFVADVSVSYRLAPAEKDR